MSKVERLLPWLALVGVIFTLFVMGLGAFTRLVDGGLGCPDWPGCYGHWRVPNAHEAQTVVPHVPLVAYKAWAEMIHRYVAGTLGLLITVILSVLSYVSIKYRRLAPRKKTFLNHDCPETLAFEKAQGKFYGVLALSLFFLIVYQILLGRWTVTLQLLPIIVIQHLLGAMGILCLLWLTFLRGFPSLFVSFEEKTEAMESPASKRKVLLNRSWIKRLALVGFLLLFLQIILGAWTSTHYGSLSCKAFPFCGGKGESFVPAFKEAFHISMDPHVNYEGGLLSEAARKTIHMIHRGGALVVTLYFLLMGGFLFHWGRCKHLPWLMVTSLVTLFLLFLQVTLGIGNVLFQLPLALAIAHNSVASLLLLAVVTLNYGLRKRSM